VINAFGECIMPNYLTAQQVKQQFGLSRNQLLRYEAAGLLGNIERTPGGQRRYNGSAISNLINNKNQAVAEVPQKYYSDFGTTGLNRWNGHIDQSDELRELRGSSGIKIYREMRKNDPVISAIFFAIENSLKQANKRIKASTEKSIDKQAAEFVESCLSDMSYAWSDTMDFACQMLEVGVSPLEISYKRRLGQNPPKYVSDPGTSKYSDGRVGWRKWSPRPIESLAVNDEWIFDDNGNLQGLNQVDENGKKIAIPISKLLIFRTTAAPYNSPQSDPIHRAAYTSYYYSKNFQEIEGIGVERDLNGIPIVYLGNDCTKEDFTIAKDLVVNMRVDEQAGIVVPHAKMGYAPEGQGMLVELLSSFNSRSHNVDDIITRYDKRKALSVLTQFIMLGMDKYGSFALSKTQNDLFVLAISAWLQKIADVINMYAIPRLINYNVFPGMTGMPEIAFNEAGIPDLSAMATFVNSMVGNEVIHPDAELERHLRQMARLPDPVPVDVNKPGGNLKPKPIAETALIIRRIILALKELPSYSTMSDENLMAMLEPMVAQMQQGIELETGVKIPNVTGDISGDEKQLRSDIEQIWQQLIKEGIV